MASASSPSLQLRSLELPLPPSHRRRTHSSITSFVSHSSNPPSSIAKTPLRQSGVSPQFPLSSRLELGNGFFTAHSLLNDFSVEDNRVEDDSPTAEVKSCVWNWRGYSIRYQCSGNGGPALVLIHGFGANSDHWRKNIPVLAKSHRVYSIDLIGYGYSDKPNPHEFGGDPFYTFETWAAQIIDFCHEVVKDRAFFICNSIG
ncbi:hypothetical protein CRG98_008026, partial [Punica granatum]